jgi:tetratricopeptide (TPR) repeat protein
MAAEAAADISDDESSFVASLQFAQETGMEADLTAALRLVNRLFFHFHRTGRLGEWLRQSLSIIEGCDFESDDLAEALFRAGGAAHVFGRMRQAGELLDRAEAIAQKTDLGWWRAESLRHRGELAANMGLPQEAEKLLSKGSVQFRELGDMHGAASCLRMLGYAMRDAGQLEQAKDFTNQALRLHVQMKDLDGQYWCIGSLGAIHLLLGEYDLAARSFEDSLAAGKGGEMWNLTMLAEVEVRTHNFQDARSHLESALQTFGADEDNLAREWPLSLLGEVQTKLGELVAAEESLEEALRLHRLSGSSKTGGFTLVRLAELHLLAGGKSMASTYFEEARNLGLEDLPEFTDRMASLASRIS